MTYESMIDRLTQIVHENKKLGIEISKKYKKPNVVRLVNYVKKVNPGCKLSNDMTVEEYSEYIKDANETSKKFKTSIIDKLLKCAITYKDKKNLYKIETPNKDLTLDLMNKRIDNLEKVDKQLFIYSVALNIVLKATIMSLHNTKTLQENVKNLIDNFDYEMKYDLPLDDFRGLSYEMHFDDEFQSNVRKMVRRIIG